MRGVLIIAAGARRRRQVRLVLRRRGLSAGEVLEAANASVALMLMAHWTPTLVICDLEGLEMEPALLLGRLRAAGPSRVLAYSAAHVPGADALLAPDSDDAALQRAVWFARPSARAS